MGKWQGRERRRRSNRVPSQAGLPWDRRENPGAGRISLHSLPALWSKRLETRLPARATSEAGSCGGGGSGVGYGVVLAGGEGGPSGVAVLAEVVESSGSSEEARSSPAVVSAKVFFRIKRSTQLKKLMNPYCDRQSVDMNAIAFLFDGRRLRGEQTPDELEMEDGDEIDAMLHQTGGCLLPSA